MLESMKTREEKPVVFAGETCRSELDFYSVYPRSKNYF